MKTKYNLELFKLQAELCKAFADPSRLIIIQELRDGEKSVSELQAVLDIPRTGCFPSSGHPKKQGGCAAKT